MIKTNEGANQYEHSMNDLLEFFSKAGSLRDKGKNQKNVKDFYSNKEDIIELFEKALTQDVEIAFKLLFWLRDIRQNGAGNRSGFRKCLEFAVNKYPAIVRNNLSLIPLYGRYDDLRVLFGTEIEREAAELWGKAILAKDGLACKWADRSDKPLLRYIRSVNPEIKNEADFRKYLAKNRTVVEQKMCSDNWNEIEYPKVPSKAMANYTKAFNKHDSKRFEQFKTKLEKGEVKINVGALFPHDCALTAIHGDYQIADEQFNRLPNYLEGTNEKIMVLCDSSGSMDRVISGSTTAFHISTALSLYCSDRLGKDNPFYRKFMEFEDEGKFKDWTDKKFSDCYKQANRYGQNFFNGACGSTRIDKALDTLLGFIKMFNVPNDKIPTTLMVLSDMQFTIGNRTSMTEVERCLNKWVEAGYSKPKVIYWNLVAYKGQPADKSTENVALISGFSPSILKAVLSGTDFSPIGVMIRALEKYNINMNN